ncbi:MAG: hypothetical protein GX181_08460 [Synergistaceae bacterium]|nr:hypothetical protein [Synergistota bacterium]NLM71972.1 hypothetical protein [Synergistaceae bacterium]
MILWVPSFIEFVNDEVAVVQRGLPWSSYLMIAGVLLDSDGEGCCRG